MRRPNVSKVILLAAALVLTFLVALAACAQGGDAQPFQMTVMPQQLNGHAISGQRCVFLVTVSEDPSAGGDTVKLSASAPGATVTVLEPEIAPGRVAEVVVAPESPMVGSSVAVTITATRGDLVASEVVSFEVIEGEDDRAEYATELIERFVPWLEANHPELGITGDTEWTGTMVSPQWLVVSHYLFFSEEWELHLSWHIMVAPDDWARIDLRHRFDESQPSYAFEISSVAGSVEPVPMAVPETVWR